MGPIRQADGWREPTRAVITAIAEIADEDTPVLLARIAAARPELRDAVLGALEEIDTPRAADPLIAHLLRADLVSPLPSGVVT